MKHYINIENLKEGTDFTKTNTDCFKISDYINITEKIDGANASFKYNKETNNFSCWSHRKKLDYSNTLRGFWNWVQNLDPTMYKTNHWDRYVFFGEWLVRHHCEYNEDAYLNFYLFDVWDTIMEQWLPPYVVRAMGISLGLKLVPLLYEGRFKSWEHCRSFMNSPSLGNKQEGIVVKNITREGILKIVNKEFLEVMKRKVKVGNSEKIEKRNNAEEIMKQIVTEARVRKQIYKLIDEGILPEDIGPNNMKEVAKNLPKRVFEDCLKECEDVVMEAGEYGGKVCASISMKIARELILG